jgi:hypothetical protein
MDPEAVRRVGAEALHSALVVVPGRELPGARFHPAPRSVVPRPQRPPHRIPKAKTSRYQRIRARLMPS